MELICQYGGDVIVMFPNFVVIGAPKSGTTSLFYYLRQHPDIYLPVKKELHYFSYPRIESHSQGPGDLVTLAELCSSKEEYRSHYRSVNDENAIGEVSPSYLYYAEVAEQIKRELGQIKIIVILRNPVEKAYSQYMHLVRDQREKLKFYDALFAESGRKKNNWGDFWLYASSSLYSEKLRIYQSVFGRANVKVVIFDDFIEKTDTILVEIFEFLNVDSTVICDTETIYNRSGESRLKSVSKFFNKPNLLKSVAKVLIPERIRIPMRLFLLDLNTGGKNKMDPKSRDFLLNYFRDDVRELETILKRELSWMN